MDRQFKDYIIYLKKEDIYIYFTNSTSKQDKQNTNKIEYYHY